MSNFGRSGIFTCRPGCGCVWHDCVNKTVSTGPSQAQISHQADTAHQHGMFLCLDLMEGWGVDEIKTNADVHFPI